MLEGPAYGQTAYAVRPLMNDVKVVNTATDTEVATIPVGASPQVIAASPNGARVYVGYFRTPGSLSVIDTATNLVTATIPLTGVPSGIAVSPDSSTVYVTIETDPRTSPDTVAVISASTNTVIGNIGLGLLDSPHGIAVTPNGSEVYVADSGVDQVTAINTATNAITARIAVTSAWQVAVAPSGSAVYLTSPGTGSVSVISTSAHAVAATIPGLPNAHELAVTPDGFRVYVTYGSSFGFNNSLSFISTITNAVAGSPVVSGAIVNGVAITPDGVKLYVAVNGNVTAISTATGSVISTATTGSGAGDIAISIAGSGTATRTVPALSPVPLLLAALGLAALGLRKLTAA